MYLRFRTPLDLVHNLTAAKPASSTKGNDSMKKSQARIIAQCSMILLALLLTGASTRLSAQVSGVHPGYEHAIRDLREADGLLQHPYPQDAQLSGQIAHEVEEAIGALKTASHIDDKSLSGVPPEKSLDREGRYRKVQQLLNDARGEVRNPESDPHAESARNHGIQHIDSALNMVGKIVH
jgi:hypothetical protein